MRNLLFILLIFLSSDIAVADVTPPSSTKSIYTGYNFNRMGLYLVDSLYMTDDSGNTLKIEAPELADDLTVFTLPSNNGTADYGLATDGNGVTSWIDVLIPDKTQTVTNKTIDADLNTITNLEHGLEVDDPASGVHGVTGNVVGTSDAQVITNKDIDADFNTVVNLEHGLEVDNPSSGVHGVTGDVVGTDDTQTLTNKGIDADTNTLSNIANASISATAAIEVSKFEALASDRALISGATGIIEVSDVTNTEIGYLDGVTSNIQTQIDNIPTEVVEDLTPQLGGDLDVNGNAIVSVSDGDILINPDGSGALKFKAASINGDIWTAVGSQGEGDWQAPPVSGATIAGTGGTGAIQSRANNGTAGVASGQSSIAIGNDSEATQSGSVALGGAASATGANSTALGAGATTTVPNEVMLGYSGSHTKVGGTQLVLAPQATEPTGIEQGAVFYDTAENAIKTFDGTNWNKSGGGGLTYTESAVNYTAGNLDDVHALADIEVTLPADGRVRIVPSGFQVEVLAPTSLGVFTDVTEFNYNGSSWVATVIEAGAAFNGIWKPYSEADVSFTGGTIELASLIPYKLKNDTWKLNFNIVYVQSAATTGALSFGGTTFSAVTNGGQAVTISTDGNQYARATTGAGTDTISWNSTTNGARIRLTGDVLLEEKPTWVDFNPSEIQYTNIGKSSPIKAGMVMAWPDDTLPEGWLEANGSAISRTDYADLFAALGTKYGVGDGSTTFNLPDYRGEFLRGHDNGRGADPDAASRVGGDVAGSTQTDINGSHLHDISHDHAAFNQTINIDHNHASVNTNTTGSHSHNLNAKTVTGTGIGYIGGVDNIGSADFTAASSIGVNGDHLHTVDLPNFVGTDVSSINIPNYTGTSGATGGNETRPRNVAVKWIVKAYNDTIDIAGIGTVENEDFGLAKKSETFAVGSVQQSILTETQFQNEMGTDWVLMNGADITGSKLATLTGNNTLPDATGRFLRSAGGNAAALAVTQPEGTARNGLGLSWTSANASTGTDTHNHGMNRQGIGNSGGTAQTGVNVLDQDNVGSQSFVTLDDSHSHTVNKNQWNSNQSWTEDNETRPINLTVNTFIKIN